MNRNVIHIPSRLEIKLNQDDSGDVNYSFTQFAVLLKDNRFLFFPEYTDHGIEHIENVIKAANNLIPDDSLSILSSKDVMVLLLGILIHDIGMHLSYEGLEKLLNGSNDHIKNEKFDKLTWKQEWVAFFQEAKRFSDEQLENVFGDKDIEIIEPDMKKAPEYSKRLYGEFLRRNHARLAHEIAIIGFPTLKDVNINLSPNLNQEIRDIIGLVGRSHGIELRKAASYLRESFDSPIWFNPYDIKVIYLMSIIRISDFIQIDKNRSNDVQINTRKIYSPLSQLEHQKHGAIQTVTSETADPELIFVQTNPKDSKTFLALEKLFKDIQYEFDVSWAVLGEIYGHHTKFKNLKLRFRRIRSSIDDKDKFDKTSTYVPEKVIFDADPELLKLLVGPLYGEDPKFGVRELIQNSIDAINLRQYIYEMDLKGGIEKNSYQPQIEINLEYTENTNSLPTAILTISDNGNGMSKEILINYFFRAGASFRKSNTWKKNLVDGKNSKVPRTGRFGIGVLAAFLLGDEIEVFTKNSNSQGYYFKTKLSSKQIELEKIECPIGTKLIITLKEDVIRSIINSEQQIKELTKQREKEGADYRAGYFENAIRNVKLHWFDWYYLASPKVNYHISKNISSLFTTPDPKFYLPELYSNEGRWRKFSSRDFKEIYWTISEPEPQEDSYYRYSNEHGYLFINGIKIPKSYSLKTNFYYDKLPSVSIFDLDAKFPLSLNRNYIQNEVLPFEDELLSELAKDIIARILTLEFNNYGNLYEVSGNSLIDWKIPLNIKPHIIISDGVYTLDYPYILNQLKLDKILQIWLNTSNISFNTNLLGFYSLYQHKLTSVQDYKSRMDSYPYSFQEDLERWFSINKINRRNELWRRIFIKTEKFEYLKKGDRLRRNYKKEIIQEKSNLDHWESLIYDYDDRYPKDDIRPKINYDDTIIENEILNLYSNEIDLILEKKFDLNQDKNGRKLEISSFGIFESLLNKYFSPDFTIPIDPILRNKKYPKAFKELKRQLGRYHS